MRFVWTCWLSCVLLVQTCAAAWGPLQGMRHGHRIELGVSLVAHGAHTAYTAQGPQGAYGAHGAQAGHPAAVDADTRHRALHAAGLRHHHEADAGVLPQGDAAPDLGSGASLAGLTLMLRPDLLHHWPPLVQACPTHSAWHCALHDPLPDRRPPRA